MSYKKNIDVLQSVHEKVLDKSSNHLLILTINPLSNESPSDSINPIII